MRKVNVLLLALSLLVCGAVTAGAAERGAKPKAEGFFGQVKSVDLAGKSFVVERKVRRESKEVTVKFDDKTKFLLNGEASTADAALVVGQEVRGRIVDEMAVVVEAGKAPQWFGGAVKSVDLAAKSFVVTRTWKNKKTGQEVSKDLTVKFDDKTKFVLDGQASTADAVLVAGKEVRGQMVADVAKAVESGAKAKAEAKHKARPHKKGGR